MSFVHGLVLYMVHLRGQLLWLQDQITSVSVSCHERSQGNQLIRVIITVWLSQLRQERDSLEDLKDKGTDSLLDAAWS